MRMARLHGFRPPALPMTATGDSTVPSNAQFAKFASLHGTINNHINKEIHLASRQNLKCQRAAALTEWCQV